MARPKEAAGRSAWRHVTFERLFAFIPWDAARAYLVCDNDGTYGPAFTCRIGTMVIGGRPVSPRSPWQNPYVERLIRTLRRDCLDHVLIFGEQHLRRALTSCSLYYNEARTHLELGKDTQLRRAVQRSGTITVTSVLAGLHHRYPGIWFSGRARHADKIQKRVSLIVSVENDPTATSLDTIQQRDPTVADMRVPILDKYSSMPLVSQVVVREPCG